MHLCSYNNLQSTASTCFNAKKYTNARYVDCASHRLNLALSNVMSNASIRNCLGVISQVANLFRNYTNANTIILNFGKTYTPESKEKRLLRFCVTRFIERHDSIITFIKLFECIAIGLEEIADKIWSMVAAVSFFFVAIQKSDYLVSLVVCKIMFSCRYPIFSKKNL